MRDQLRAVLIATGISAATIPVTLMGFRFFADAGGALKLEEALSPRAAPAPVPVPEACGSDAAGESHRDLHDEIARLERRLEEQRRETERWSREAARLAGELEELQADAGPEVMSGQPASLDRVASVFDWLASTRGPEAYTHPKLPEIAERARDLGEEGLGFVRGELAGADPGRRALAAMVAEKLDDPAFLAPLQSAALQDADPGVREAASRALSALNHERAPEALTALVQRAADARVRLHAWAGLARLGRKEALNTFESLLDMASGQVGLNDVVLVAVQLADEPLYPALRLALDREGVDADLRARIQRLLATAPPGG